VWPSKRPAAAAGAAAGVASVLASGNILRADGSSGGWQQWLSAAAAGVCRAAVCASWLAVWSAVQLVGGALLLRVYVPGLVEVL